MPQLRAVPLTVFLLVTSLLAAASLSSDTLFLSCSGAADNFTSPSPYASNLLSLISALISTTPETPNLFSSRITAGPSQAFGLAQCRPDASPAVCSACLANAAAAALNTSCPGNKSASVRNVYCVLRYADHAIASVLEYPSFSSVFSPENASNPALFGQQLGSMLSGILPVASSSPLRIAGGVNGVDAGMNYTVYGLAWCTADLSPENCYQCLDHALMSYTGCCDFSLGGGSITISCIVSYNILPFFNASLIQNASAISPPPTQFKTAIVRRSGQRKRIILAVSISAAVVSALILIYIIFFICRKKQAARKISKLTAEEKMSATDSHLLPFSSLKSATNNFSVENKLREGRFGPVYEGVLSDGQRVLVKRLPRASGQGLVDLKNEAALVSQLQHRNLVKLLGCCVQDDETLLVYEYLPNASLDKHLYDPARRAKLDWETRHLIIEGIARGLVYLHNHSRLRIIHRDLNCTNILLDAEMNPKISDFGHAKLVGIDESQWDTKQIAGTSGYMAPEYALRGLFSTKSDVFSYGMVVLEIITGRRNGSFTNLQTYVWQNWSQEKAERVIDEGLDGEYRVEQVLMCIKIGLLCVQAEPEERPSMATVVLMLSSDAEMLPAPSRPAYFTDGSLPISSSSELSDNYVVGSMDMTRPR
ncbi:Cysteine-rich receptor-like protein kinase 26 [Platanthera zijinensis]|uniref:Cysteine-rich receptor-like protein kinase 26 n=1 Tax=Platanthera zijinensis TaxID=2320716 RepID=A0AAP0AYB5_9ASPA